MMSTTFDRLQTAQTPRPVQRPAPTKSIPALRFGALDSTYATGNRIDDDIYHLLLKAPKNELHVHQGGSSDVGFLSYCLRKAINEGKIDSLPLYNGDGGYTEVQFKDKEGQLLPPAALRDAQEAVLTISNLRNYYRYQSEMDNQRPYMSSEAIAETTAIRRPKSEVISSKASGQINRKKELGLQAYRQASNKINPHVKNNPGAYMLAYEYAKSLAFENVHYTEYRVSPSGNGIGGNNGSDIEDMLSSVHSGFEDARAQLKQRNYKLDYGILVLFERQSRQPKEHEEPEPPDAKVQRAVALAKQLVELKKQGKYNIVGVDLAGNEANNPVTEFKPAFDIIKKYNATALPKDRLGITIHAGETAQSKDLKGYESVARAIDIAHDANTPVRIGHGLQIINSSPELRAAFETYLSHPTDWERRIDKKELLRPGSLLSKVIKDNVILEMCPKSNLQTYGIHPGFPGDQFEVSRSDYSLEGYSRHPAVFLSRLGVKIAISSDNRTISNTDVTNEYVKLFKYAGLTYQDFKQMVLNGFEGAFIADPDKKKALIEDAKKQFYKIEHAPERIKAIRKMNGGISTYQKWILLKSGFFHKLENLATAFQDLVAVLRRWWHEQVNRKPVRSV